MFFNPRANYVSGPLNGLSSVPPVVESAPTYVPQLNQRIWRPSMPMAAPTQAWTLVPTTQPMEQAPFIIEKKADYVTAKYNDETMVETERLLIEEMRLYNNTPRLNWLFIILGILLIILGIINTLFCLSVEQMYYARYWTGILLIIFAICGYIHRGNYLRYWKNILYIVVGIITTIAVFVCSNYTLIRFLHQVIEVAQFQDWASYVSEMSTRMGMNNDYPKMNLTNPPDTNLKVCFVMSGLSVLVDLGGYLVATVTVLVIDKFYSSHFVITRRVQPFCTPVMFNPYGQVSLGQAQVFIGFVLQSAVFGNSSFPWQGTYAPVIAGAIPIVAGVFAAISLKSCGVNKKIWNLVAIILEVLSIIASCVAIIFISIGMADNITTLGDSKSGVMTYTMFSKALMVLSIFNFCVSDVVCIVNIFYSVALIVHMILCLCFSEKSSLEVVAQEIYSNNGYRDDYEDRGFREYSKKQLQR